MELSDKLLKAVIAYGNGNRDAFNIIYEESNKYIYTCIYKVVSGNDNTQDMICDVMQDTYVQISKSIDQLEHANKFLPWAGMIATRKCYQYLKKSNKYVLLNEEDTMFENLAEDDSIIPEEVMQSKEKQRLLREIIDTQLTEVQKLCIIAYYYNEQKQSEIAEVLGIPENTVKTNLSRAKAKIKDGVLDLEKNKGTRLYSVAPLLLLLFKEDLMAAVVPAEISESVQKSIAGEFAKMAAANNSVTASVASKTGLLAKNAALSIKTILISAITTIGIASAAGGVGYVVSQKFAQLQEAEETEEEKVLQETEIGTEDVVTDETQEEPDVSEDNVTETESEETNDDNEEETELTGNETATIRAILLHPDIFTGYYPESYSKDGVLFAVTDLNHDGIKEVYVGDDISSFKDVPQRIFNVLYEKDGAVYDLDGDHVYDDMLIAGFSVYENGIIRNGDESFPKMNLWNMYTGESWQSNGTDGMLESLCVGEPIQLEWYLPTEENIQTYIYSSGILLPSGIYKASNRVQLDFANGSVFVTEGNSTTKCTFTVDETGKLTIIAESEILEGTYDSVADVIYLYGMEYKK